MTTGEFRSTVVYFTTKEPHTCMCTDIAEKMKLFMGC